MSLNNNLFIGREWKVSDLLRAVRKSLASLYGDREAESMARLIFYSLKGWDLTSLTIHCNDDVSDFIIEKIESIVARALKHEPLQYILGDARFYGLNLKVTPDVLIPRVETEELVDMIIRENGESDLRVLDIGTGSGAIAVALARNLKFASVTAIDISRRALDIALENARILKTKIKFCQQDVFAYNPAPDSFDVIVSNPPYIAENEKKDMDANVLDFEPRLALFVSDDNPLIYYSRIAEIASVSLCRSGRLYLEINPLYADDLRKLLCASGFVDVEIMEDSSHKKRFAKALKK